MQLIQGLNLLQDQWLWLILAAFLIGFSKAGISSFTMPAIPIVASVFGGKDSTGIILPMLIVGDIFALYYYNRHAEWKNIRKLLPWTLLGLILGVIVGIYVNDKTFKACISVSVLICLVILIYTEKKGENLKVPQSTLLYALTGILCGFTSMIGNAAGPIFSVYLLAKGFKKNDFMGTTAWFFFIINLTKVPLQIFFWNNIPIKTIYLTGLMIPAIAVGAFLGVIIIKKLNERLFHLVILGVTALAAIKLLIL
ncbi:sulfite exporter TauE/SafE family protein [Clostridium saccharoperbutylacetonicum]|uniref:sulfite exporter TauE/SafE family protein n=1 Tax=Clostridium saccharoperbutylacetonicum TaxID=36745 RepID=UPI0039EB59CA